MDEILKGLIAQVWGYLPMVALSAGVFLLFWAAGGAAKRIILRFGTRTGLNREITNLASRCAKTAMVVFGIMTALGTAGINVSALVAGLGLTGFALGFALKDALSNMLTGILILVYRPFTINDLIAVGASKGTVVAIDFRYTTIQAEDKKVLIPNSALFTKEISLIER